MFKSLRNKRGQGMTEYILIVALVAILAIVGIKYFGKNVSTLFKNTADKVKEETTGSINNTQL